MNLPSETEESKRQREEAYKKMLEDPSLFKIDFEGGSLARFPGGEIVFYPYIPLIQS